MALLNTTLIAYLNWFAHLKTYFQMRKMCLIAFWHWGECFIQEQMIFYVDKRVDLWK